MSTSSAEYGGRVVIVATRNAGKLAELRALLRPMFAHLVDLTEAGIAPSPVEDNVENGTTFEANALAKARFFAARSNGRPVIADDSGLRVRALGGAPGVYSRRYAGATGTDAQVTAANLAKLLGALDGVDDRRAAFTCALAYVDGRHEVVATGHVPGRILHRAAGHEGFGYDPVFWSDELECSFGEASTDDKARVSHRARAVGQLLADLHRMGVGGG